MVVPTTSAFLPSMFTDKEEVLDPELRITLATLPPCPGTIVTRAGPVPWRFSLWTRTQPPCLPARRASSFWPIFWYGTEDMEGWRWYIFRTWQPSCCSPRICCRCLYKMSPAPAMTGTNNKDCRMQAILASHHTTQRNIKVSCVLSIKRTPETTNHYRLAKCLYPGFQVVVTYTLRLGSGSENSNHSQLVATPAWSLTVCI